MKRAVLAVAIMASMQSWHCPQQYINSEPIKKSKKPSGAAKARRAKNKRK